MKRILIILPLLFLTLAARAQNRDYSQLDSLLSQFYTAMESESIDDKCGEFDNMILMCKDSLTRQHVAINIFEHYKEPRLMGDEDVCIHIFDVWLDSGLVSFPGDMYKMEAEMFVEFNRNNLIGCKAPVLQMKDKKGKLRSFPTADKISILYFYDTSCGKCKLEAKVLPGVLEGVTFPADFYAIFCGQDLKAWKKFTKTFKVKNKKVSIIHLEDKDFDTDYLKLYGVISTPKLYMVGPKGLIFGRRLEAESLKQMIPIAEQIQQLYE